MTIKQFIKTLSNEQLEELLGLALEYNEARQGLIDEDYIKEHPEDMYVKIQELLYG